MSTERQQVIKTEQISKKDQRLDLSLDLPSGVTAKLENEELTINGPLGKVKQDFSKIPVNVKIEGGKVEISTPKARRKNRAILNTARSLVQNAIDGVTKGYEYKLK